MQSKKIELIVLVYLLSFFCIPSSLGLFKRHTDTSGSISAASWSVDLNQTGVNNTLQVVENGSGVSYTLNVVSNSEVDITFQEEAAAVFPMYICPVQTGQVPVRP